MKRIETGARRPYQLDSGWLSWQRVKRPLASIVLTLGLLASGLPGFYFKFNSAIALPSSIVSEEAADAKQSSGNPNPILPSSGPSNGSILPSNGIYLYGQSPEPNQVGHTYAVFEVTDSETVGAFYMPSSSFDCFYGEVDAEELDLVVVNSYEQEAYPYSVALTYESVASGSAVNVPAPEGYHRIDELSQQDYRILDVCRSDRPI